MAPPLWKLTSLLVGMVTILCVYWLEPLFFIRRFYAQRMYMLGFVGPWKAQKGDDPLGFDDVFVEPHRHMHSFHKPVYLLIMVSSSPHDLKHRLLREAIRDTWGNCKNLPHYSDQYESAALDRGISTEEINCTLVFYSGRSSYNQDVLLQREVDKYGDLVIGNFADSYFNMTRKMLFAMNWASQRFTPHYILKTDDDVFINVPKLIKLLQEKYGQSPALYGGHLYFTFVNRDPSHRHFLGFDEFAEEWYPPYCKGAQLVISGHLLPRIVGVSKLIPRFQIDDAYLGLIMRALNVIPTNFEEFIQIQWMPDLIGIISECCMTWAVGLGDSLTPRQLNVLNELAQKQDKGHHLYCFIVNFPKAALVVFLVCIVALFWNRRSVLYIHIMMCRILGRLCKIHL